MMRSDRLADILIGVVLIAFVLAVLFASGGW